MTRVWLLGAGKFAAEVGSYLRVCDRAGELVLAGYLVLPGEELAVPDGLARPLASHVPDRPGLYLLATAIPEQRRELIEGYLLRQDLRSFNLIHRSAVLVAPLAGTGNVVGPFCHVGSNVRIGSFNVFNAHCSIGHHSVIGDENFFAPDCHCGNSVTIGTGNLFGIGTAISHGVRIQSGNRVQVGAAILEDVDSEQLVTMSSRTKQLTLYRRQDENV